MGSVPVVMFFLDDFAESVRPVVSKIEEERPGPVLLDELNGVIGDDIGGVSRLLVDFALPNEVIVVKGGGVSSLFGEPIGEALLRMQVVAEVPFARQTTRVSGLGQDLRQGAEFLDDAIG